jgi:hypothetical protein
LRVVEEALGEAVELGVVLVHGQEVGLVAGLAVPGAGLQIVDAVVGGHHSGGEDDHVVVT